MRRDLIGLAVAALALACTPAAAGSARGPGPVRVGPAFGHGGAALVGRPGFGPRRVAGYRGFHRGGFHRRSYGFAGGYGFAGLYGGFSDGAAAPAVVNDGSLLALPRPQELVPSAWGYGTYGIPTVAGIAPPPKADPVVYVIDGVETRRPASAGPGVYDRRTDGTWRAVDGRPVAYRSGAARVVEIAVPRR